MALDFDSLTLGEVATIEDLSGTSITALSKDTPQGKFLAAIYMVMKRRDGDPTYTFNKALGVTTVEAQAYLGLNDDADAEQSAEGNDERSEQSATE